MKRSLLSRSLALLLALVVGLLGACGGGGGSSAPTNATMTPAVLSLLAGNVGGPGNVNGTGAAASFNYAYGVATDSAGNVYVADTGNNVIRKITPAGVVTTLAGTAVGGNWGSADGTGPAASFDTPWGICIDGAGNLYVADSYNGTIRKITPAGVVTTLAGMAGNWGSADGTGPAASFDTPSGLAIDGAGNLYVADAGNNNIRMVTPAGVVTTLAGTAGVTGSADGTGPAASFASPSGLAIDGAGNVYVADTNSDTIRMITPAGVVTTLAGTAWSRGSADGTGPDASFAAPGGLATDSAGNVYVADTNNHTIRKITPAGVVTTLAGTARVSGSADGTGAAASFNTPRGVGTDNAGNVYVADTSNSVIRMVTPAGVVTTIAGTVGTWGSADGTGAAASFQYPGGLGADSTGNVYVADTNNHTIRMITPAGVVTTLAGTTGVMGSADGTGAAASFSYPSSVATDSAGNLYVADNGNHTIRKITPAGVVTTLAGTAGVIGSTDATGAAASFANLLVGVTTDSLGNVYVADVNNHTIRKITPAGVVTTLAGTAGVSGSADGTGAAASFNSLRALATDSVGNVYAVDYFDFTIRKITPAGVVTTIAGTAGITGSADGTGSTARFNWPQGIASDGAGNLYVADTSNSTIRKITPAGVVTTVVGSVGAAGFVPGALPGALNTPWGLAFSNGTLYILMQQGVVQVTNVP